MPFALLACFPHLGKRINTSATQTAEHLEVKQSKWLSKLSCKPGMSLINQLWKNLRRVVDARPVLGAATPPTCSASGRPTRAYDGAKTDQPRRPQAAGSGTHRASERARPAPAGPGKGPGRPPAARPPAAPAAPNRRRGREKTPEEGVAATRPRPAPQQGPARRPP